LRDLLWQVAINACEVGETLRRQDADHAGLAGACKQRNHMPTFTSECRELVDDDEARSRTHGGHPHQVQQDPCADLRRQLRVRRGIQAEQHRPASADCVV